MKEATFYFDGACLPVNPGGTSTFGIVGIREGKVIAEKSGVISHSSTNNIAEWTAFIEAIKEAQRLGITHLTLKGDSQLVVKQINNIWGVRDANLRKLYRQAKELMKQFKQVKVLWIGRKKNLADSVAHEAYIKHIEEKPRQRAEKEKYQVREIGLGQYELTTEKGKVYIVQPDKPSCNCPLFRRMNSYKLHLRSGIIIRCKHIFAVQAYVKSKKYI